MSHTDSLDSCLNRFKDSVNENPRIKALVKKWEPLIVVESSDSDIAFSMIVRNQLIEEILPGMHEGPHMVHLRATEADLKDIFSGRQNPARAFLDGELEVFGDDKDRVKLDAISLILWGI